VSKKPVTKLARLGDSYVVATDIRTALLDYQIPSDEALQQAFQLMEKRQEVAIQATGTACARVLQRRCIGIARSN
jgi:hypothetical protein